MHAADDDSSTLLPPSSGIEREAADKAESAARAAASRVTAWLQRSPTGPLARASCADAGSAPSAPEVETTSADAEPTEESSAVPGDAEPDAEDAPRQTAELDAEDAGARHTSTPAHPAD